MLLGKSGRDVTILGKKIPLFAGVSTVARCFFLCGFCLLEISIVISIGCGAVKNFFKTLFLVARLMLSYGRNMVLV